MLLFIKLIIHSSTGYVPIINAFQVLCGRTVIEVFSRLRLLKCVYVSMGITHLLFFVASFFLSFFVPPIFSSFIVTKNKKGEAAKEAIIHLHNSISTISEIFQSKDIYI